ncbi:neurogenic locus notch homolog protein 1-like, partial [Stegodyphus dumicola]|uniref:neurogenic locus notch homolog protein 1-like n=1 Tax=Stegodyphus dumicola TaxID=202533 RepID=UPI0015ADF250
MKKILLFVTVLITSGSLANVHGFQMSRGVVIPPGGVLNFNCFKHFIESDFNAERCQGGPCENGGLYCTYSHSHPDLGVCICLQGTSGDCCSVIAGCRDALCGHNKTAATCQFDVTEKLPECVCSASDVKFDYTQQICRKSCEKDDDCLNSGKCTGHGKFKFCQCLPGTEGDFCSEVTECKKNNICGTSRETICTYDNTQMQATCKCLDPSKQIDYKEKICKGPCKNDTDCETGHKCIGDKASKFCECEPGKTVNSCSHVKDCHEPDSCGIGNDTTCEYYTVQRKAKCQCLNSNKQFNYREKICQEPCRDNDCENDGKCTGIGDFKFCECLPGTAGDLCSEVTDCNEADFCAEGNDTTCIYNSTRLEAMCQCLDSSKQFDYTEKVCR